MRTFPGIGNLQVVRFSGAGQTVESVVARYMSSGLVEYAEPDYVVSIDQNIPNIKIGIVADVQHFVRRTAELAACHVKHRRIGLDRPVRMRREDGLEVTAQADCSDTRVAVGE